MVDEQAFGLSRDALAEALTAENIDVRKYYDPPCHKQTAYLPYANRLDLPNTDWLAAHSLSFPIWSRMDQNTIAGICQAMEQIYAHRDAIMDAVSGNKKSLLSK